MRRRPASDQTSNGGPAIDLPPISGHLGPYYIDRKIGHGGMSRVYLAHSAGTDRTAQSVAIKVSQGCEIGAAMLVRESLILHGLDHPGVVRVHHVGRDEDLTYLAMEEVRGCTLRARLREEGVLPLAECLDIGIQVCEVLEYLHGTGSRKAEHPVFHGDIKPSNLMIDKSGRVTLIDFGIAHSAITESDRIMGFGTPGYMAPEQWAGDTVDAKTDLFMLGVVLFELATGMKLFPYQDLPTLHKTASGDASWSPINHLPGTYTEELLPFMDILSRCVADAHRRTATAADLAASLRMLQEEVEAPGTLVAWTQSLSIA